MTTNNDNDLIINYSLHDMKNCVTSRSLAFDLSISISEAQTIIDRRVNEKHCHRYEVTRCQRFDNHDDGKIGEFQTILYFAAITLSCEYFFSFCKFHEL